MRLATLSLFVTALGVAAAPHGTPHAPSASSSTHAAPEGPGANAAHAAGASAPAASAAPIASAVPSAPPPVATPPSPPPIVDLSRFDDDAAMPQHAEDVVDYTLSAALDPAAHTVHGEGTITWRNTSRAPATELWVHLYLNAFKNQKSVFLSEAMGAGGRGDEPPKDWGSIDVRRFALREANGADLWPQAELSRAGSEDETDARVPLPRPIAPGETIHLDVVWDDKLPSVVERTGYDGSFHMVAQWFPKIARLEPDGTWAHFPFHHLAEFYSDFGTYDVTLDVPAAFVIGATGPAVESRIDRGLRRLERHVQQDVHDFAWTAWDKWQLARTGIDGVDVSLLYPPGYRVDAERELATMRFALPHFGALYGRYPYAVLTMVHPPDTAREAGGMEYPTLITTGGPWWMPASIRAIEHVTIHEFGHQYFYGLLASNEEAWPFLDEGLNSYAEQEGLGAWLGAGSLVDLGGLTVSDTALQAFIGNGAEHDQAVAQAAPDFTSGSAYGAIIYERTGAIVETFRRVYGDDALKKVLGRYARRWRFSHPDPEALIESFRSVLGAQAALDLRSALFDRGWVDYAVTGADNRKSVAPAGLFDRGGKRELVAAGHGDGTGFDGWVVVTRRGTLHFPIEIDLLFADGTRKTERWDGQGEAVRIPYHGNVALVGALVDPNGRLLLDDKPTNNHFTLPSAPRTGVSRTTERASYFAELLLQVLSP